jgi:hypothetical protein
MAQVVEPHRRQPRTPKQWVERCAEEPGRPDGRANLVREHQVMALPGSAEMKPLFLLTNAVPAK